MCNIAVQKYIFPRSCKTRNNTTIDVIVPDVIYLSLYIIYILTQFYAPYAYVLKVANAVHTVATRQVKDSK